MPPGSPDASDTPLAIEAERTLLAVQNTDAGLTRELVFVSGSPGAGKSSLAVPLAKALGFPLLRKDVIKESLFDSIGDFRSDIVATSDDLDPAAMALLWRLASHSPQIILEATFKPGADHEASIRSLSDRPVEVYCRLAPEAALDRYNQRGQSPNRHRVHYTRETSMKILEQYQQPLRLGPVIEVNTNRTVDIAALAESVRSALRDGQPNARGT